MEFKEAKNQFIQTWGKLGSEWGINRTMAQVHALLLISNEALDTDRVMQELQISRGNANMNLRDLLDWNLVYKEIKPGDRKEYFVAEKDIWEIAKRITKERKKRELEPLKNAIEKLKSFESHQKSGEEAEFLKMVDKLDGFIDRMDRSVDMMIKADESWFFGAILKLIK